MECITHVAGRVPMGALGQLSQGALSTFDLSGVHLKQIRPAGNIKRRLRQSWVTFTLLKVKPGPITLRR